MHDCAYRASLYKQVHVRSGSVLKLEKYRILSRAEREYSPFLLGTGEQIPYRKDR